MFFQETKGIKGELKAILNHSFHCLENSLANGNIPNNYQHSWSPKTRNCDHRTLANFSMKVDEIRKRLPKFKRTKYCSLRKTFDLTIGCQAESRQKTNGQMKCNVLYTNRIQLNSGCSIKRI